MRLPWYVWTLLTLAGLDIGFYLCDLFTLGEAEVRFLAWSAWWLALAAVRLVLKLWEPAKQHG